MGFLIPRFAMIDETEAEREPVEDPRTPTDVDRD